MTETIPNQIPNSGTAERLAAIALPGALMGGGYGAQEAGWDTVGTGLMAAGALGSRPGSKLMLGAYPLQQSAAAEMMARALRATPAATRMKKEGGEQ